MSVDPNTIAQLLSLSFTTGNQNVSDQSNLLSGQTNSAYSNLFGTLLMLMMNNDSGNSMTALSRTASEADTGALTAGASADTDRLLWQQLSSSVSPLGQSSAASASSLSGTGKTSDYEPAIQAMSKKYSVDANLIRSVIEAESGGNPNATSAAGAEGLMQLMPGTAAGLGVTNAYDPVQNIEGGTKYLRKLLDRYNNNYALALAAYNAGSGNVEKYGGIPPFTETQAYVKKIMNNLQTVSV
ncbi:lytic transglycosylase domain-containing protein [Sporolactobacillus sp. CPB3-1]|uniref:Lytic transglycosylase domain-containing protein n=1 Tax=Sporolactobacillus mangiferae TaxID=2940498 RepID=A0ABT0M8S6_9BACL|nr:lytic transglycosylase domain-containing protein [Sporolactobacillus mangiferae]MCL1631028.1 lytic transglycosylase domain-containing protein [Sporolactobacillus mangiferae]